MQSLRDISAIEAAQATKRAILADVQSEIGLLEAQVTDAEEDPERAEARLDDSRQLLDDATGATATGQELPDLDPDAVARTDLVDLQNDVEDLRHQAAELERTADQADIEARIADVSADIDDAHLDAVISQDLALEHTEFEAFPNPTPPDGDLGTADRGLTPVRAEPDALDPVEALLEDTMADEAARLDEPTLDEDLSLGDPGDDIDPFDE